MDLGITGRKALVTGSTAGIGFAAAKTLAMEGARVVVNGRTQERVETAVQKIKEETAGADVTGIVADLGGSKGCEELVDRLPDVDMLVNNVGIFGPKPFEQITDDEWITFYETNVLSGVRLSRHYVKGMRSRDWGRIVFVSSESGLQIPTEMIHYGMTKTAQLAVARGLAETLAGTGVTVNAVLPGPTDSEGVGGFVDQMAEDQGLSRAEMEEQFFRTARPTSIIRRFADTDEVAAMIAYVCSARASATTGACLRVDGGVVRAIG
jgi:NAD(P)-dependent dehydrogenase (short-subunit alcohol dehydrogenase family)